MPLTLQVTAGLGLESTEQRHSSTEFSTVQLEERWKMTGLSGGEKGCSFTCSGTIMPFYVVPLPIFYEALTCVAYTSDVHSDHAKTKISET